MSTTVLVLRMAHRKSKETKQQPSMLSGPAVPGCSLVSFHFLWAILCPQAVQGARALSRRAKTEEANYGKKGGKGELGARARNEGKETKPDLPTSDIVTPVLVILSQNVI